MDASAAHEIAGMVQDASSLPAAEPPGSGDSAPPKVAQVQFPSAAPTVADRASALLGRLGPLLWLYALVPVPLLTDWIENSLVTHIYANHTALSD